MLEVKRFTHTVFAIMFSTIIALAFCEIVLRVKHHFIPHYDIEMGKYAKTLKVKVPKGGMLILNTLMWHAGAPNYSDKKDRHLLVAHYTPSFVKLRMNLKGTTKKNVILKDKKENGILDQLLT